MDTLTRRDALARLFAHGGPLELMGRNEAAEVLGVKPSNLPMLKNLPAPVVEYLPRRPLWLASDIRKFAADRAPS